MADLLRDLRYAARGLIAAPAFTLAAVVVLALGTGVNVAVMGLVDQILLRPLPYADADRLVAVFEQLTARGELRNPTSPATFLDWRRGATSLEHMTAARPWAPVLRGDGAPQEIPGLAATPSLFRLLAAEPLLGRGFAEGSDDAGVVVLSHDLWQRRFGGDQAIVGRSLELDGTAYEVIGVMPPGFAFPPFWAADAELWVPLVLDSEAAAQRQARFLRVFARLRDGASLASARRELATLSALLAAQDPQAMSGVAARVEPLLEPVVGGVRTAIWLLFGAVGCVLLLACANVGNLVLVRGLGRRRELAVRRALGASGRHLLRLVAIESLLLAVAGTGLGLLLAWWLLDAVKTFAAGSLPRLSAVTVDGRVMAYAALVALAAVCLFGVLPLLRLLRGDPASSLASATRGAATPAVGQRRIRRLVVALQLAAAVVLVVGAGLMVTSLVRLDRQDPGFAAAGRLVVPVSFAGTEHEGEAAQARLRQRLQAGLAELPEVRSVALVDHAPIVGDLWRMPFSAAGASAPAAAEEKPKAAVRVVSAGYFESLGIAQLAGRDLTAGDGADAAPVVIVNRTLAERYFAAGDAVGRTLRLGAAGSEVATIVGVVEDARQATLRDAILPEIYRPYAQNPNAWWQRTTLVLHTRATPAEAAPAIVARLRDLAPELALGTPRPLEEALRASVGSERFETAALGLFAALGLVLAAVGLYGLMSFLVRARRADLGLRMVVGARRSQILGLVLGEAMRLVAAGLVVGLLAAAALARTYAGLVYGVHVHDVGAYAGSALLLLATAAIAAGVPAWRASRLDPAASLRSG